MKRDRCGPAARSRPYFPDSRIGASLKRHVDDGSASYAMDFPDSRIGASLKQQMWYARASPIPHFPDSRIGASLKRWHHERPAVAQHALPRFANRGLIEAISLVRSATSSLGLPRFANRGLIEAPTGLPTDHVVDHFPDSRIGASLKPGSRACRSRPSTTSPIRESGPH